MKVIHGDAHFNMMLADGNDQVYSMKVKYNVINLMILFVLYYF